MLHQVWNLLQNIPRKVYKLAKHVRRFATWKEGARENERNATRYDFTFDFSAERF